MLNDYFVKIQIYISNMYICTYIHTPHTLIHTSHVYSHTHLCTLHYDTNAASGWLLLEKHKHLPSHPDDDKALWWSQVSAPLDQCFLGGTISSTLWFQAHCVADAHSHDRPEFDQFPELPCIWLLSADFYSFFTLFNSARCWPLLKSVKNCLAFPPVFPGLACFTPLPETVISNFAKSISSLPATLWLPADNHSCHLTLRIEVTRRTSSAFLYLQININLLALVFK